MPKFYGKIGYAENVKVGPGVWKDTITEKKYYGDVTRISRQLEDGGKVNNDLTVSVAISVVADAYANMHFHAIRYIEWAGALWTVKNVRVESPRLIFTLGGVYNGETAPVAGTP